MSSGRQDLQLSFMGLVLCFFLVSSHVGYAKEVVSMPVRPFAIDPVNWHLVVDGIFDVSFDEHIIGVFLENKGKKTISNVTAAASFPTGSGIKIIEGTYEFEDLERNKPVLGFFRASFGKSKPGKYPLTLNVSGEVSGKPESWETSRDLFVIRSEFNQNVPNQWTVKFPEGKLIASISEFNNGSNPGSSMAPKEFEWFVEYIEPYKNRYSDLPLSDPWLKVMGSIAAVKGGLTALDDRIKVFFGEDCGKTAKRLGLEVFSVACMAVTADDTDPFRMGQEEVEPGDGEFTEREGVEVLIEYPPGSVVGTPFDAVVEWTYTRTTNVKTYPPRKFKKSVRNTHFAREPEVKSKLRESGGKQEYVITARTREPKLRNNEAYLVANLFEENDIQLKKVLQSIILRDDGHKGDREAGDGTYTGVVSAESFSTELPPNVFIFLFDMNNTPASCDALSAAGEIGGLLNAASSIPLFPVKDEERKKKDEKAEDKEDRPKFENPVKKLVDGMKDASVTAYGAARFMAGISKFLLLIKINIDGLVSPVLDDPVIIDENEDEIQSSWDHINSFSGGAKLSLGFKILPFTVFGVSGGYRSPTKWTFEIDNNESTLSSHSFPLELFLKISAGKLFFRGAAGLDFYKSTIVSPSETFEEWDFGKHLSLGTGYFFFKKRLALTFDVWYAWAKLDNVASMIGEDLVIDLSGLKFSTGIKLRIK